MNYEMIDMGAYNLHIIKTTKFKTITVEVNFREKMSKDSITMRNLLKSVLLSTNNSKTSRSLSVNIFLFIVTSQNKITS